jgi:hypothetical protein
LALDAAGNVYVGSGTSNVVRVAPRGDLPGSENAPCVTTILSDALALEVGHASGTPCPAGLPGPGFRFAGPKGIALSSDGTVYVAGTGGAPNLCDNVVGIFPDGTIVELVNRNDLGLPDWNPAGIAVDEGSAAGVFVYATGPLPASGVTVRINPDRTFQPILKAGGQGLVVDERGNVYIALTAFGQLNQIPDARSGICGVGGKVCPPFIISGVTLGCDGQPIKLVGPYGLALAGRILYVTGQDSNNVIRIPLSPDNVLGLPLCAQELFSDGTAASP